MSLAAAGPSTPGIVELDAAAMRFLLALLDQRLRDRRIAASIYVIGGAAIALAYDRAQLTPDIDAAASQVAVFDEAEALAREHGLPLRWLNDSGVGYAPRWPSSANATPTALGLTVHIAPIEHLIAMKLRAYRTKDVPDIATLLRENGMLDATPHDLARILADAYDGEDELADALGVPRSDPEATRVEAHRRCEMALKAAQRLHREGRRS